MKIHRMFRVCGKGRTQPSGTLTIVDDDGDGNGFFIHVTDAGDRTSFLVKGYEVHPMPEEPMPTGTITGRAGEMDMTWHFYRELPVTGERIVQTVSVLGVVPKIVAK
jgi:hypothetical protein